MPALFSAERPEAPEPPTDRRRSDRKRERALWLFIPNDFLTANCAASPSAPDTAASIWGCTSPSPDIALWVTSSGKPMRRPLSWRGWGTRPWLRRLYGTICDPSTADRGAAAFISSLPVIPASPSARPATVEATPIRVTSGPTSPASCAKSDRDGSSWRTSKATSPWALGTSPESFRAWVTASRLDCSRRLKRARRTFGSGSSFWPTPTASDAGYFPDLVLEQGRLSFTGPADAAQGSGGQFSLSNAARTWSVLWRMLEALGATPAMTCRSSPPVRVSFQHGRESFITDLTSNPAFYEMAMGWPIGWTGPEAQVTGFAAWLRRSRGALSALPEEGSSAGCGQDRPAP